jgi:hypothetical protein
MQCGVKRKRRQSTEFDIEHQHTLFDMSMMKLHQEHMRNGMEPRLVRFVLINNALKLLQMHMLRLEEGDALGSLDYDGSSSRFFCNTFRHGTPAPLSPLASPTKSLKLEQSQLLVATPFQSGEECPEEEEGPRSTGGVVPEERRVGLATVNSLATVNQSCSTSHLGKRSASDGGAGLRDSPTPPTKKTCQERSVNGVTSSSMTSSAILEHLSLEPAPQLDLTPSQDFAKVDPAMYDYDIPARSSSAPPPSRPCTMQAIGTPVVQNGDTHSEERDGSESPPETSAESDFLDELDHIVNLLMT